MRNAAAVAVSEEVGNIAVSSVGTSCCPRFTHQTTIAGARTLRAKLKMCLRNAILTDSDTAVYEWDPWVF